MHKMGGCCSFLKSHFFFKKALFAGFKQRHSFLKNTVSWFILVAQIAMALSVVPAAEYLNWVCEQNANGDIDIQCPWNLGGEHGSQNWC